MPNAAWHTPADRKKVSGGSHVPSVSIHSLDEATERVDASSLDQSGVRTVRVLNESRFLSVLERMVEERLKARTDRLQGRGTPPAKTSPEAPAGPGTRSAREEFQARWEVFRCRYEEKLRKLEARLEILARAPRPPA